ncbi:MAG: YbhB/YbcL family Raf kinase inhibitor-like protein [Acidimicrobiales bacterium]|nr:YbhB/YbcL family Raf kinase inhibitor-like protein [Acidimicrobiales bacterium]
MPRRLSVPRPLALAVLVVAAIAGACSDDGRTLAPIGPGQTTTTETDTTEAEGAVIDEVFSLTSDAFADGGDLPPRFTCTGDGLSPSLRWSGTPSSVELALVVRDREVPEMVHWIVTGIDPVIEGFGEAGVPEAAVEQVNSTGAVGWLAPCPEPGTGTHTYDFVLHVLTAPVDIDPALPAVEAAALIEEASGPEAPLAAKVATEE